MLLEEKACNAFNLKTPWPSICRLDLFETQTHISKAVRTGRGRGKDRAGAQRPSSQGRQPQHIQREKDDYTGTSQSRGIASVRKESRDSIRRSRGHCEDPARSIVEGCRGKVRRTKKLKEKERQNSLVGDGSALTNLSLVSTVHTLSRIRMRCPYRP